MLPKAWKVDLPNKPTYKKIAQDCCFFDLFRLIEKRFSRCFIFESLGEESHISRYHVIGFDPEVAFYAPDQKTLVRIDYKQNDKQAFKCDNPYFALRHLVPQNVIAKRYAGGLVGYLAYDSVNLFEPAIEVKKHPNFDSFRFGLYDDGLVYDQVTGEIFYYFYQRNRFKQVSELMDEFLSQPNLPFDNIEIEELGDTLSQQQHRNCVLEVKQAIIEGLIFQCEVGFKSKYRIKGDLTRVYDQLRQINPSPHMYFVKFDDQQIIGASPELLLRVRDREMETYPLAGTTKRGHDSEQDRQLARALLNDPKEIAEHNMLVDLHRNDLGRVASFGSVKVRNLMDIRRYSHVQHISSEIAGILAPQYDGFDALASNFPAGTLSGAPKIEAMKIIETLENEARGPYAGAVGHFGFNGDCTFAIAIRSLFISGDQAYAQTCGGNVLDSKPEDEYLEIKRKLSAMRQVLERLQQANQNKID